jgi:diphthamide biosynthesis enzyme Dph1/Dph2-like protein
MKTLFIPAKIKSKIEKSKIINFSKKLPKNIGIAYSIQYKNTALEIKKILSNHKITKFTQILGCSNIKFPKNTEAILVITSGMFHILSMALKNNLPVFRIEKDNIKKISREDIKKIRRKQKASYVNFLNSNRIGVLVSTKSGQQNLKKALEFSKKIKKQSYIFIGNNLNINEFENYEIEHWVNTACPRLDVDSSKIINISQIIEI